MEPAVMVSSIRRALFAGLLVTLFAVAAQATDPTCGSQACEEPICASDPSVFKCTDWNDAPIPVGGGYDGWSISGIFGDLVGEIESGIGLNGSKGWHVKKIAGSDDSRWWDTTYSNRGSVYLRFVVRFGANWNWDMCYGLYKLFYLTSGSGGTGSRLMLGTARASATDSRSTDSRSGGNVPLAGPTASGLPNTTGYITFDYSTPSDSHNIRWYRIGDSPVLLQRNVNYSVELHAQNSPSHLAELWITPEGGTPTLQSVTTDFVVSSGWGAAGQNWTNTDPFNFTQETFWNGGDPTGCGQTEDEDIYGDNIVLSDAHVGPPAAFGSGTAPIHFLLKGANTLKGIFIAK